MRYLVHRPKLMRPTRKAAVTRFARTLEPGIACEYETLTNALSIIKIDFAKQQSYDIFVKYLWGE